MPQKKALIIIIIICYIYIALFWVLKVLYIEGGISSTTTSVQLDCVDDATAAILRQNAHHTPAYCEEETEWWRQSVYEDD